MKNLSGEKVYVFIPGPPQAKERPRFRVHNGRVMTYTPKRTAAYEQFVAECIRNMHPDYLAYEGAIQLTMKFVMPFPKSKRAYYHTSSCAKLIGDAVPTPESCLIDTVYTKCRTCKPTGLAWYVPVYPMGKPDLDNLEKAIMDGLEKSGVIVDDKQVVWKSAKKEYGTQTGVLVEIIYGVK